MTDYQNDDRDGALFRWWIRAASYPEGCPGELMRAIQHCTTPEEYRKALTDLSIAKGANMP